MAWGLGLADLKKLAHNSLAYSGMFPDEKRDAIENKWLPEWKRYIAGVKAQACAVDWRLHTPSFQAVIPTVGIGSSDTVVHVYGGHFERAICSDGVVCRFGERLSPAATYVSNSHVTCRAPPSEQNVNVSLAISFDGGKSYFATGRNYTYVKGDRGRYLARNTACQVNSIVHTLLCCLIIALLY